MTNAEKLLMFKRIKSSADGPEFIEYLKELSKENYIAFKLDGVEQNEVHRGYAIAVDSLIDCFEQCDVIPEPPPNTENLI